jgi:hypothetical protein
MLEQYPSNRARLNVWGRFFFVSHLGTLLPSRVPKKKFIFLKFNRKQLNSFKLATYNMDLNENEI